MINPSSEGVKGPPSDAAGRAVQDVRGHGYELAPAPLPAVAPLPLWDVLRAVPRRGRVLGATPAAVYLELAGRGAHPAVLAVVAARSVHLPLALRLTGDVPLDGLESGATVGGGAVRWGRVAVRPARWVDPRPRLAGAPRCDQVDEAARILQALAPDAGLDPRSAPEVAAALSRGDPGPAMGLIGAGPGLTPAGDDLVAGVLAALAIVGRPEPGAVSAIVARAAGATTSLSAALLRCAAAGQMVPQAGALLRALVEPGPVGAPLRTLLAVGATSGPALALGLVEGVRSALAAPAGTGRA